MSAMQSLDVNIAIPRPNGRSSSKLPIPDIEWIGGTGSAQDLISERDLSGMKARESDHPINIMTTNCPSSSHKQFAVNVPSIGIVSIPYVLPETPAVLSIGQRCMDEGFDFVWKAYSRPYQKTFKVKGSTLMSGITFLTSNRGPKTLQSLPHAYRAVQNKRPLKGEVRLRMNQSCSSRSS